MNALKSVKSGAMVSAPPSVLFTKPVTGLPGATVTGAPEGVSGSTSKPPGGLLWPSVYVLLPLVRTAVQLMPA